MGVKNPNKPGKVRLYHDAKARADGVLLNSVLHQGPDLANNPIGCQVCFCEPSRLVFKVASLTLKVVEDQKIAKRQAQSIEHRVYDPLGTLAPTISILKKLAHSYTKYAWDHPISEEELDPFCSWVKKMPLIGQLSIRRWYGSSELGKIESKL
jgi:hypothetical protein